MKKLALSSLFSLMLFVPAMAHEGHHDESNEMRGKEISVKGEIVDMACYLDHNAMGPKHAECAKTCIESGLPVGIRTEDGKVYLLIGEHKPMNKILAEYAAKTVTVKGKFVSRDGFNMVENAEVLTK